MPSGPLKNFSVYTTAKAGLAGLTLRWQWAGTRVRVNGVAPGAIPMAEGGDFPSQEQQRITAQTPL